jgi:DNA-binding MarR family transcriptional regulator/GNAT superfamily N-acetyltransferase
VASPRTASRRSPTDLGAISSIRDFNRFYTRQLGLLDREFLSSEWTLTEVRVLYELATRTAITASEIAGELQLDMAYLSRILARFQQRRLLRRQASPRDGRQRLLTLTTAGRAVFKRLDRAATAQIASLLAPLPQADRTGLVAAMQRVRRVLQPCGPSQHTLSIRPLGIGDIGWIIHRQGVLYAAEYGWDVSYEALVAEILSVFVKKFDPKSDGAWIAECGGEIVGCVFLVRDSSQVGRLRLLYVEPAARGQGIGSQLVVACIRGARERGYHTLTLWTNDVLVSARRIYEAAGFHLVGEERHHSFGKALVGQTWELSLAEEALQ